MGKGLMRTRGWERRRELVQTGFESALHYIMQMLTIPGLSKAVFANGFARIGSVTLPRINCSSGPRFPLKSLVSPPTLFWKSSHSRASFIVGDRLDLSRFLYSIVQEQCPELEQSRGLPDYDIVLYRRRLHTTAHDEGRLGFFYHHGTLIRTVKHKSMSYILPQNTKSNDTYHPKCILLGPSSRYFCFRNVII